MATTSPLQIVTITGVEDAMSSGGKSYKRVKLADGRQFSDWDQSHFAAYQIGRTIGLALNQSADGRFWNVDRGADALNPNPQAQPNGTYSAPTTGQTATASGLVAKDFSIHRQKALDLAVQTLGYVGVLAGLADADATARVLQMAERYVDWLDQRGF